jgi:hypothetical protein
MLTPIVSAVPRTGAFAYAPARTAATIGLPARRPGATTVSDARDCGQRHRRSTSRTALTA